MDLTFKNRNKPYKGAILLSDPFEADIYFTRSVVLLCNHEKDGSFGFVLNNYVEIATTELNSRLTSFKGRISIGWASGENEPLFYSSIWRKNNW